jgi:alkanesulfonate monooxygenase SsuD/methylene tetrahydromethanopterin reductase-like flavin-dependent oxidoreductase (luciferase family)
VPPRELHLGVSLDGAGRHPAAWRATNETPEVFSAEHYVRVVQEADRGGLDFVVLEDGFDRPSAGAGQRGGRLDALLTLARVAPVTRGVGLVAAISTTHTEPFHISKNVATLDIVSTGRAGWKATVSTTEPDADLFGRKGAAPLDELYDEAADAIEVVRHLWDSWEDDAIIRDNATGRYIDRAKLHYIDYEGRFFRVRGPSITPRSPQGQPVVVVDATSAPATRVAAEHADVALIECGDAGAAAEVAAEVRGRAACTGRATDVAVLAVIDVLLAENARAAQAERARLDALAGEGPPPSGALDFVGSVAELAALIEAWHAAGEVDGFVLRPALLPTGVAQIVDDVIPILGGRGLFRPRSAGGTLRDRFGWPRPENRYVAASRGG